MRILGEVIRPSLLHKYPAPTPFHDLFYQAPPKSPPSIASTVSSPSRVHQSPNYSAPSPGALS